MVMIIRQINPLSVCNRFLSGISDYLVFCGWHVPLSMHLKIFTAIPGSGGNSCPYIQLTLRFMCCMFSSVWRHVVPAVCLHQFSPSVKVSVNEKLARTHTLKKVDSNLVPFVCPPLKPVNDFIYLHKLNI